ncbi:aminotransferase class V-fold PLP-dependent enzyme [Rhodohalobacter sp. 8-1]|uniref:aminotransferase class V-fold PLP-dependent enzyme n=1 Tax=Rhodohalobacter sp. 8-1 TaxID=3131972 RepID=UPI0030EEAA84
MPDNHHYLNCSYLSPLLKRVEQAGIEGVRGKSRPWETTPDKFFQDSEAVRSLFAGLIHAENPEQIAIMPAVSYGMGTVVNNLPKTPGREIVIAGEQFPSNVYPWEAFARRTGMSIKQIDAPEGENRGEKWNEAILNSINNNTLLVALGNVHWTDGTVFRIREISEKVHSVDGFFVIDGTQSVGALPLNVQDVKPDALICAGYKWLMGPYGIALGYFGPRLTGGIPLEEGWIVRKNSEDFTSLIDYEEDYQPGAKRYDVGQRSNFITLPMMREALAQVEEWGIENIQAYIRKLTDQILPDLIQAGYKIEDEAFRPAHMFGARVPDGADMNNVKEELQSKNIHVSVRGSAIRISPHLYNDETDIEALKECLLSSVEV